MIDIFLDRLKAAWFCLLGRGVICNIRFFRPVGIEKTKNTKMLISNSHFTYNGILPALEFLDVDSFKANEKR